VASSGRGSSSCCRRRRTDRKSCDADVRRHRVTPTTSSSASSSSAALLSDWLPESQRALGGRGLEVGGPHKNNKPGRGSASGGGASPEGGVVRAGSEQLVGSLPTRSDSDDDGDEGRKGAGLWSPAASRRRPAVLLRLLLLDRPPSVLLFRHSDSSLATMSDTLTLSGSSPLASGGGALDSVNEAELLWRASGGLESGCCSPALRSRNATISTTDTFCSSAAIFAASPPRRPPPDRRGDGCCVSRTRVFASCWRFRLLPDLRRRLALPFSSRLPLAFPARDTVPWLFPPGGVRPLLPAPSAKMAIFSRTCPGLMTVQMSSGVSASSPAVWSRRRGGGAFSVLV